MVGGLLAGFPSHLLECLGGDGQQFVAACLGEHRASWGLYCPAVFPSLSGVCPDDDGGSSYAEMRLYPLDRGLAVAAALAAFGQDFVPQRTQACRLAAGTWAIRWLKWLLLLALL